MARLVYNNRAQVTEMYRKRTERRLERFSRQILYDAIGAVPIRTGRLLRSSRLVRPTRLSRIVAFVVFYAGFVEYGTRRMRAQPYLMPAFWRAQAAFVQAMQQAINHP